MSQQQKREKRDKKPRRHNAKCGTIIHSCEKCGHQTELHITAKSVAHGEGENPGEQNSSSAVQQKIPKDEVKSELSLLSMKDLPVAVQFQHDGFWVTDSYGKHIATSDEKCDRNSVMISKTCLLYVYKLALRHYLLSYHMIEPSDIDNANLVPHVMVRKNPTDSFSKHKSIQGEAFIINEAQLSLKSDFLLVELDEKRGLHFTLIYKKKLGKELDLIDTFKQILRTLNKYPQLIDQYRQLDYFGSNEISYWFATGKNYPLNVVAPEGYNPPDPVKVILPANLSAAGSLNSF